LGAIACAATAAALAKELKDAGVGYGPCPAGSMYAYAFICKPAAPSQANQHGSWHHSAYNSIPATYGFPSASAACAAVGGVPGGGDLTTSYCYDYQNNYIGVYAQLDSCDSGYTATPTAGGTWCAPNNPVPDVVSSDTDMQQTLQQRMDQDYQANRRLYDAMKADQEAANRNGTAMPPGFNPVDASTPVSVTAPPVTLPKQVDSETQVPKPDGSTDTIKKESQTTVTPKTTGTTAGDSKTVYQTSTVITTTVTNNVSNQMSVTNQTVNDTAEPSKGVCDVYPDIVGCQKLGEPPKAEAIPRQDVPVTYTPVPFASAAGCPSPISYEAFGSRMLSYQPMCDWLTSIRPLFLALGALACAWIFMESLKS